MGPLLLLLAAVTCTAQTPAAARAVVLDGAGPWQNANWSVGVTEFSSLLNDAGYQVKTVSPVNLASTPPTPDMLLAVPSLESLPLSAFKAIAAFVAAGGSLMASGGQPFRDPLYPATNGQWLDQVATLQALAPANTALDPAAATLSATAYVPVTATQTTVAGPDGQSKAVDFQLQLAAVQYYLLTAPVAKPAFQAGQTATIVSTRGTLGQAMLFSWIESDGSKWIATVPLTTQWTKQVLLPGDFVFQPGSAPSRAGTTFNPAQATTFYFGVSTVDGAMPGPVEFAVSAIGTAVAPTLEPFTPPVLETISPSYKQYVTQMAGQTVRVPVARGRGLTATQDPDGRFRAIGDLRTPSATWYVTRTGTLTIWLPWPHLSDPQRAQLVALLAAAPNRLYILNAGPTQLVTLPTEDIVLGASVINAATGPAAASLNWSILDSTSTVVAQSTSTLSLTAGQLQAIPAADVGQLPSGNYTVTASLLIGTQQVDSLTSQVRVFDPTLSFQPAQQISAANGSFSTAAGSPVFLQGVNYWPRYWAGVEAPRVNEAWLMPQDYDPDLVEADLTLLASLNFNLVSFLYTGPEQARSLVDFLDRCRNHGMWANIALLAYIPSVSPTAALFYGHPKALDPNIGALLQAAFLPNNDRVFAYDLLWEPVLGLHSDRLPLDSAWRAWISDQYGSSASAEAAWGFTAPRDASGQISNPLDSQIETDGAWRVMVAANRRFIDDYESRSFGAAARLVRAAAPTSLLSFRQAGGAPLDTNYALQGQGTVMLNMMAFELGAGAAHLDFISPQGYSIPTPWPAGRGLGFASAYARYRSGGKPIYWSEYGFDAGATASPANLAAQVANCDSMMRLVNEDGSSAASVWWMPGGWRVDTQDDYGILNPDGSTRQSALTLAQWGATFAATPPTQAIGTPVTLTIDRDADARGDIGVFLNWQKSFVQARQTGSPVVLTDAGRGTDTSSLPQMQVGNVPYTGSGPLKYANGEFAGIRVQCPGPGIDVTVENGATVPVPAGSVCQLSATMVNTASATWLPTAQSTGGVVLHTSAGDLPLASSLGYLERTALGPLPVTLGPSNLDITGRLAIQGTGAFGEVLHITLAAQ